MRASFLRGLLLGACLGGLYFLADLAGALMAIGFLLDRTASQLVLLAVAGGTTVLLTTLAGGCFALAWTRLPAALRQRLRPSRRLGLALSMVALVLVTISSYASRRTRQLPELGQKPPVAAARPASVLFVVIDTLRADTLYGERRDFPLAPAMGALAGRSTVFWDAESAAGWTIPSVATLMTGMHPERLYSARGYLPSWAPTLAERLRAAGYRTHAVVDNTLLEPRTGFADGFESFFQRSALRFAFTFPGLRLLPTSWREELREQLPVFYYGAPGVTDEALAHVRQAGDAPILLYVHYMDVHYPYYPHPEISPDPVDAEPVRFHEVMTRLRDDPSARPSPSQMALLEHRYQNELRYLDRELGRLLDAFQERYGDDSLVVITADHGEEFLEHGGLGHGHTLHRELTHVPLIVKLPRGAVPEERQVGGVEAPVGLVDVLPTVLDALGVPGEVGGEGLSFDGASLLPALREQTAPERQLFASQNRYARRVYRYREGSWVLINTFKGGALRQELFDLSRDPGEHHDRLASDGPMASRLGERMEPLHQRQVEARDPRPSTAESDPESLRALGYVQ